MKILSLTKGICVKTWETSQNTDIVMREFLRFDKALQTIQSELINNSSKLTKIDKRIKRGQQKLKEIEYDLIYFDEQWRLYKDTLEYVSTE